MCPGHCSWQGRGDLVPAGPAVGPPMGPVSTVCFNSKLRHRGSALVSLPSCPRGTRRPPSRCGCSSFWGLAGQECHEGRARQSCVPCSEGSCCVGMCWPVHRGRGPGAPPPAPSHVPSAFLQEVTWGSHTDQTLLQAREAAHGPPRPQQGHGLGRRREGVRGLVEGSHDVVSERPRCGGLCWVLLSEVTPHRPRGKGLPSPARPSPS